MTKWKHLSQGFRKKWFIPRISERNSANSWKCLTMPVGKTSTTKPAVARSIVFHGLKPPSIAHLIGRVDSGLYRPRAPLQSSTMGLYKRMVQLWIAMSAAFDAGEQQAKCELIGLMAHGNTLNADENAELNAATWRFVIT